VLLHDGGLYFSSLEQKIRRVDLATGVVTTVAGTGVAGYSGDGGPAVRATLDSPQRMVADAAGNIYVADSDNNAVRRIDAGSGVITTVAGTGVEGLSGDGGRATSARLDHPRGVELEGASTLYVADSNNHRVRRVDLATGTIHSLAGTVRGFAGDGGPAREARLYQPRGLTLLSGGRLLVADTFNNRLRVIDPEMAPGPVPDPAPDPGTEMFTNRSVEQGPDGFDGTWSTRDEVTWSSTAAVDGSHSMRITNVGSAEQAAGLVNLPLAVSSTRRGHTYIATAWVSSPRPDQRVMLRVQECAATCLEPRARTITLDPSGWHQVTRSLVAQTDGSELRFAVVARALPPGASIHADLFGMVRQAP
jgi:DNA-binding beta-propeller fold protein YncE